MSSQCSEIRELLSPYIDDQVSAHEREVVDAHLRECDACAEELATLRETVALLRRMPQVAAPRSFALQEPARRPFPLFAVLRMGSALAAAVFVVLLGVDVMRAGYLPFGSSALSGPPPVAGGFSAERREAPQAASKAAQSLAAGAPAAPQAAQAPAQSPAAAPAASQPAQGEASSPAALPTGAPFAGEQDVTTADRALKSRTGAIESIKGSPSPAPTEAPAVPAEPIRETSRIPTASALRLGELAAFVAALISAGGALWVRRGRTRS